MCQPESDLLHRKLSLISHLLATFLTKPSNETHFPVAETYTKEASWARGRPRCKPPGEWSEEMLVGHVEGAATLWLGVASHTAEPSWYPSPLLGDLLSSKLPSSFPELQVSLDWLGFNLGPQTKMCFLGFQFHKKLLLSKPRTPLQPWPRRDPACSQA